MAGRMWCGGGWRRVAGDMAARRGGGGGRLGGVVGWGGGAPGDRTQAAPEGLPTHLRGRKRTATHTLFFSEASRPLYMDIGATIVPQQCHWARE